MGSGEGHDVHGAGEGAMSVRFGAFDTAWKQTSEMPVDGRVCECCLTTAAMTSDSPVAAYRDRSEDEIRDTYVAGLIETMARGPNPSPSTTTTGKLRPVPPTAP